MKRVNFFKNVVLGMSVLMFSVLVLMNCEPRRDGARDTQTTANIEAERQELANEIQREISQLDRMITDYDTRREDDRLPQETRNNYRRMSNDLGDAKSDLESELNRVQNANPDNWHERRAEARQTLNEVQSEVEQIQAGRGQDDGLFDDDGTQRQRQNQNQRQNQTF
jgi:DNA repair exonuclease SbcCD ATPase subunit